MGLCSKRTLKRGSVPCINKNDCSEAERERSEKCKYRQLVDELLEESAAREAAEATGAFVTAPDFVRNTGIATAPDFVCTTGNAFIPATSSENDPLGEAEQDASALNTSIVNKEQSKCRTCNKTLAGSETFKDLGSEENAVMLHHIEVITGIWIKCSGNSSLMCTSCVTDLRTAIEFRETCIQTELRLAHDEQIKREANAAPVAMKSNDSNDAESTGRKTFIIEPVVYKRIDEQPIDAQSVALGTQIYEDLLNKYKGEDTIGMRPKRPNTSKLKVKQRKSQVKAPKTEKPKTKDEIRLHRNRVRREQIRAAPLNYVCDQCGASFRVRCNLTIHMLRHTRTKNFHCSECPKVFYDAYMRNMHIRVQHKGERPFTCNYCEKRFTSSNSRYLHERRFHGAMPRIQRHTRGTEAANGLDKSLTEVKHEQMESVRHYCTYCTKSYATKYALNWHNNIHLGVKPFKCKYCEMGFYDPQSKLKHEVMRHNSKRPYECDICLKTFFVRTKFRDHERIHTGERPFSCEVCNANFRYRYNLYTHRYSKVHKANVQRLLSVEEPS